MAHRKSKGIKRGKKISGRSPVKPRQRQASLLGRYAQRRDQALRNIMR